MQDGAFAKLISDSYSILILDVRQTSEYNSACYEKIFPAGINLLKVNNRNSRTRCEICLKLTTKTPERRH